MQDFQWWVGCVDKGSELKKEHRIPICKYKIATENSSLALPVTNLGR